jgi:hypothetical protein
MSPRRSPFLKPVLLWEPGQAPATYVRNAQGLHVPLDVMKRHLLLDTIRLKGACAPPPDPICTDQLPLRMYF